MTERAPPDPVVIARWYTDPRPCLSHCAPTRARRGVSVYQPAIMRRRAAL